MLFWTIKTRVQNDEKLAFVQKVSHSFCHKIENFLSVTFKQNWQEKTCFAIFKIEKSCSRLQSEGV